MKLTDKQFNLIMTLVLAIAVVAFAGVVIMCIVNAVSNVADVYSVISTRTETMNSLIANLN